MSARLEFVDTNVLLYAFDTTEANKQEQARSLLNRLWKGRNGCLSVQVFQEFYVNATRKPSRPLDPDAVRRVVEDYGLWIVHTHRSASVLGAIVQGRHRVSFWDALILQSALELGAGTVWLEDLNAGQRFDGLGFDGLGFDGLEVRTPFPTL